ncbi:MFS transporter [Streptomyces sp. RK31]|uniref:MFS transporter n=1 Tax=Streptomyces sp. RK31 TaxID=2824892 RepID=UPI001B3833E3|nr:MFS transporter [Streptomyces sp. RK31]MBQ0972851.1 MFS transporter [Streptomyces sp. RK31]
MSATTLSLTAKVPEQPLPRWPPAIWALLLTTLVARSFGFVYPFLSYHLKHLSYTTEAVGQVLAVFGIGWLLGQLLTGWAADRLGRRRTLVTSMATAAVLLPLLAQAHDFAAVCTGALIAGIVYDAARPVVTAVIADLITDDTQRAAVNGWRHGAVNIGAALTGALGGFLAGHVGFHVLFWLNAAACAACALIAHRCLPADTPAAISRSSRTDVRAVTRDAQLWLLWAASVFALTCAAGMFSALPMLMADDGLAASAYGWTQVANAGAVIALTPLLTPWLSRRCGGQQPMIGNLAASSLLLGVGMGSAGLAETTLGYSLAVAVAVPGEIAFFIAASDVLNKISPESARGLYAGIWGSTLAVAVIIAPVLAAASLTYGGGVLTALTTLAAGAVGAALCLPLAGLRYRSPAARVTAEPLPAAS